MLLVAIPIVAKVRLPLAQKAPILGIFGMGAFVITAAVLTKVYCFVPSLLSYEYDSLRPFSIYRIANPSVQIS